MAETSFTNLSVYQWRQFDEIDISIHPRLTVLTGANGAGKTTLLNLFSQHFGWARPFLASPWRDKDGSTRYFAGALQGVLAWLYRKESPQVDIGKISYSNSATANLLVGGGDQIQFNVQIAGQQPVRGLSIPSHRVLSHYQQISFIPTLGITAQQAFQSYSAEILNRLQGGHTGSSPFFRMKEALISMATFGEGNKYVRGRPELLRSYLGFTEVLRKILPPTLGFESIEIRTPDVVLVTKSGEFLLDAVSGGLSALIDLAWQIHTFSYEAREFVVVMDEPENHLHPAMQRGLLPSFLSAFPDVQFIVATHSPFVVTSIRDSNVYVLNYRDGNSESDVQIVAPQRSVYSTKLDQVNKAGTANQILRTVLGLESTMPLWASHELDSIVSRYRRAPFTGESVESLSAELDSIGMTESLPSAVEAIFRDPQ